MIQGLKCAYSEKFFIVNKYGEILNAKGVVIDLTKNATMHKVEPAAQNVELESTKQIVKKSKK